MHRILILTAVLAMTAATANAATVGFVEIAHEVDIEGSLFNVWQMQVTAETDWTNTRLDINLAGGEFYAHPLGGITEPTETQKEATPDLEYHTWLTVPAGGEAPVVLAGEIIVPTATGQKTQIGASWGNTDTTDIGTFSIAQITLSTDAKRWIHLTCYDVETEGIGARLSSYIWEGQIGEPYPGPFVGDANRDGRVDDFDLSLLLANWNQDPTGCNGGWGRGEFDGTPPISDADLSLLLSNWNQPWTPKAQWTTDPPGEINGTPPVDDTDLTLLLRDWGQDVSYTAPGNLVGDGHLSILLANWATGGDTPEPASALVMLLGFAVAVSRRRSD